ncbi:diguanylate cyclase [Simiduia curdlanivorans]|uniref:Diguanylate cyclase domain-containing protein n=1 Tax=Simiduia curdlanivorans TaxID=1492769 RepID=A0ABV8V1U6_9GAMM|nr:diguanylate cyclase [Simiduia curdlanivorans]MDN3637464.1 diguanylate cyclase [Simiduia curdlanivorans]
MNRNGLVARLAITTVFAAATVGFVASQVFSKISYVDAINQGEYQIHQLNQTVSATASIAAYLEDEELAKEVVSGLVLNDYIKSAAIVLVKENRLLAGATVEDADNHFDINSPFDKTVKVGSLIIESNKPHIQAIAGQVVTHNLIAIASLSVAVTVAVSFIAYFLITYPIIRMDRDLVHLTPGGSDRLRVPHLHRLSEIGHLSVGINNLLQKYEEQFSLERDLRKQVESLEKKFRMLFEKSISSIVLADKRGNIILANQSFKKMIRKIGLSETHNYGPFLSSIFADGELMIQNIEPNLMSSKSASGDFRLAGKRATDKIWVHVLVTLIVDDYEELVQFTINDISKTKEYIDQLGNRASTDHLTGLLNRQGAEVRLNQFIEENLSFALVLLDLNNFKPVNDVYGHASGDEMLVHVAKQIKQSLRVDDVCARWGGDEFLLGIRDLSEQNAQEIVGNVVARLSEPRRLTGPAKAVSVSAAAGVAFFPGSAKSLPALIKLADAEMYAVKERRDDSVMVGICINAEIAKGIR